MASNANAIFVQVRRRGDSWYLDSKEPLTAVRGVGEPDATGRWTLDPLRYLVEQAHARGIEVHAFVIVGSIHNSAIPPADPDHVFNRHFAGRSVDDPDNWATRALPHNAAGTMQDGQQFGVEWYVDPGHPDAAAYTVDVLMHLVERYDVDGLHLDRIRYPESPIDRPAGEPLGMNVGYNATSVDRFRLRVGTAAEYDAEGFPVSNDPLWNQWRRDQVTALVRRVWLNATAIKPQIKVSAALITFWAGPGASGGFEGTEAYWRVFQDWESWTEEGILDLVVPMAYKREHDATGRAQFDDWSRYAANLARENGRQAIVGLGAFINSVGGTLTQARRALGEHGADGVIFYALATTNSDGVPATDFFSALTAGGFEDPALQPIFVQPEGVPPMPWKETPTEGHLMGFVRFPAGTAADGARVVAENAATGETRVTSADGGGFYGFVGLPPGTWRVTATLGTSSFEAPDVTVEAGLVASADLASVTPKRRRLVRR